MNDESTLAHLEKICPECGRKFVPTSQWAYKISTKGTYIYLCRYNCHRAAEKKLEKKTRRVKEMKSKKPSKEQLEIHLRAGALIADIARRYEASTQSVKLWIKSYGLEGIKGEVKPTAPIPTVETPPAGRSASPMTSGVAVVHGEVIPQPSLSEIEQFHTDVEAQELPKVEIDPVVGGPLPGCFSGYDPVNDWCNLCRVKEECRGESVGMTEEENTSDAEREAQKPIRPTWTQDEWESKHKEEWEAKWEAESEPDQSIPQGTCEEVWQGVLDDLKSIRRVYLSEAERAFDERFRALCAEIWQ